MSITYVRLVYTKPTPDVFEVRFEDLEKDNILLIDPVLEATSKKIGDLYREKVARFFRRHDVIVFRVSDLDYVQAIAQDEVVKLQQLAVDAAWMVPIYNDKTFYTTDPHVSGIVLNRLSWGHIFQFQYLTWTE